MFNSPILVTGCARSGTSLVAGILYHCGIWGGKLVGPKPRNKKGQFENAEITKLIKENLRKDNFDPMGQQNLPSTSNDISIDKDLRNKVYDVISKQEFTWIDESIPIFFKDAKLTWVWPSWNYAFPNATWIIVRRNEEDIVSSCMNTEFMRAYETAQSWKDWVEHHKLMFEEIKKSLYPNVYEIWSEELLQGNYEGLYEILSKYNLDLKKNKVDNFVDPDYWHYYSHKT